MDCTVTHRLSMKMETRRNLVALLYEQPLSRSSIVSKIGLTPAAVSIQVDELIQSGMLYTAGKSPEESSPGRKPELVDIRPDWGFSVGVALHSTDVEISLVNVRGRPLDRLDRMEISRHPILTVEKIAQAVTGLLERHPETKGRMLGVGITLPCRMDGTGVLLEAPGFPEEWQGFPLPQELSCRLLVPLYPERTAMALARAEKYWGLGPRYASFAAVNVGAEIDAGFVFQRQVYVSSCPAGGELGHVSIDKNGRPCPCGNRGCLSLYASLSSQLYEVQRLRPEILSWAQLTDAAYAGDSYCSRILEQEADCLGLAIVNLHNMWGLDAVLLSGPVTYRADKLLEALRSRVSASLNRTPRDVPAILISPIGDDAAIVAAAVPLDALFSNSLLFHQFTQNHT